MDGDQEQLMNAIKDMATETRDTNTLLDEYNICVRDFENLVHEKDLSLRDGLLKNAEIIKSLYKDIHEGNKKDVKYAISDVNFLIHKYKEYFYGLYEYLKDIAKLDLSDPEKEKDVEMALKNALVKDSGFVDSCIDTKPDTIENLAKNIESSLDFIKIEEELKQKVEKIKELRFNNDLISKLAITLSTSSVINFMQAVFREIQQSLRYYRDNLVYVNDSVDNIKVSDPDEDKCYVLL